VEGSLMESRLRLELSVRVRSVYLLFLHCLIQSTISSRLRLYFGCELFLSRVGGKFESLTGLLFSFLSLLSHMFPVGGVLTLYKTFISDLIEDNLSGVERFDYCVSRSEVIRQVPFNTDLFYLGIYSIVSPLKIFEVSEYSEYVALLPGLVDDSFHGVTFTEGHTVTTSDKKPQVYLFTDRVCGRVILTEIFLTSVLP
jgi:hypothetical protein